MAENHSSRVPPNATIVLDVVALIHDRIAWTYRMEAGMVRTEDVDTRYIYGTRHALESVLAELHKAGA